MPSPLRIAFEGDHAPIEIPTHACGWGLANSGCKLQKMAMRIGVSRVCDFFAPRGGDGAPPWFDVRDGLESVRGLIAGLHHEPGTVCDSAGSIIDLERLEQILRTAPSPRFRLVIVPRTPRCG